MMYALARTVGLLVLLLLLSGCISFRGPELPTGAGGEPGSQTIGATVEAWAHWIAAVATLLLCIAPFATAILGFLGIGGIAAVRRYIGPAALALVGTIIAASLVAWIGRHIAAISIGVALVALACAAFWAWKNRAGIERSLGVDIDRDGEVG